MSIETTDEETKEGYPKMTINSMGRCSKCGNKFSHMQLFLKNNKWYCAGCYKYDGEFNESL